MRAGRTSLACSVASREPKGCAATKRNRPSDGGSTPRRRTAILVSALIMCMLCLAFTPAAQAHVPYLVDSWGLNLSGQLGVGSELGPEECLQNAFPCSTTAVEVGRLGVTAMAGGEEHSLAVLSDGTVRSWGNNESGQLGDGHSPLEQNESDAPVTVSGLGGVTAVAAGAEHSLALLSTGEVVAWGNDESGQLGNTLSTERHPYSDVPVFVHESRAAIKNVTAIAAGEEHSLALLSSGGVRAWGNNESGQLGNGNQRSTREAIAVSHLTEATAIAAGEEHSLALLKNGTVVAWGGNSYGQLGDGTTGGPESCRYGPCSKKPVGVVGLSGVAAIAAGGDHSLALLNNGTVMAWGENTYGELGNGTTTMSDVPVAVKGLTGVVAIAAGEEHSLALLSNGTVMAWGDNAEGELGDGTSAGPELCAPGPQACSTTPVAVKGLSAMDVMGIVAGGWHNLAFGPPDPTVTSVSPKEGLEVGGTIVTITGTEFSGATAVKFGTANALTFKVESATSITAISPKGTGTVDVTVTTPEGTSRITPADRFTYSLNLPLKSSSANPPTSAGALQPTTKPRAIVVPKAKRVADKRHRHRKRKPRNG